MFKASSAESSLTVEHCQRESASIKHGQSEAAFKTFSTNCINLKCKQAKFNLDLESLDLKAKFCI